jgi:hypothetical protein
MAPPLKPPKYDPIVVVEVRGGVAEPSCSGASRAVVVDYDNAESDKELCETLFTEIEGLNIEPEIKERVMDSLLETIETILCDEA